MQCISPQVLYTCESVQWLTLSKYQFFEKKLILKESESNLFYFSGKHCFWWAERTTYPGSTFDVKEFMWWRNLLLNFEWILSTEIRKFSIKKQDFWTWKKMYTVKSIVHWWRENRWQENDILHGANLWAVYVLVEISGTSH